MHCQHTPKTGGNKEAICYKTDKDKIEPVGIKKKKCAVITISVIITAVLTYLQVVEHH